MRLFSSLMLALFALASSVYGQAPIPQPSGPVVFCGQQPSPAATSFEVVFDGQAPQPLTMDATKDARCAPTDTHSFSLPATNFPVGEHTVVIRSRNQFGVTVADTYTVTVGLAPGKFTITSVHVSSGE